MENLVTKSGEKHGIIKRLSNSVKSTGFDNMTPKNKSKAEKMKEDDARIVKVRYKNYLGDNERLEKDYVKYGGDPIISYRFIPEEIYEIPFGLVKEINDHPGLPQRSEVVDRDGLPTKKDGRNKRIHEFIPVGF